MTHTLVLILVALGCGSSEAPPPATEAPKPELQPEPEPERKRTRRDRQAEPELGSRRPCCRFENEALGTTVRLLGVGPKACAEQHSGSMVDGPECEVVCCEVEEEVLRYYRWARGSCHLEQRPPGQVVDDAQCE